MQINWQILVVQLEGVSNNCFLCKMGDCYYMLRNEVLEGGLGI